MHEVGLMAEILAQAQAAARERQATRIHRICVRVGVLSGVEPDALAFAFAALSPGTSSEAAELEILPVPVRCRCLGCCLAFTPADMIFLCPSCGTLAHKAEQGQELELASLEVS